MKGFVCLIVLIILIVPKESVAQDMAALEMQDKQCNYYYAKIRDRCGKTLNTELANWAGFGF